MKRGQRQQILYFTGYRGLDGKMRFPYEVRYEKSDRCGVTVIRMFGTRKSKKGRTVKTDECVILVDGYGCHEEIRVPSKDPKKVLKTFDEEVTRMRQAALPQVSPSRFFKALNLM